jgi:choline transport protein
MATIMGDTKNAHEEAHELSPPLESNTTGDGFGSNDLDKVNMARMGKTQEMHRVFRQTSLISFTAIIMGTWQWMLLANSQGLTNGGRGGLFWSYIWTTVGYGFLAASLADMVCHGR